MRKAASGVYDPLADDAASQAKGTAMPAKSGAAVQGGKPGAKRPLLEFAGIDYFLNYEEPSGHLLGGDRHFSRGSVAVLAGVPSVGKTGLMLRLAAMLATGRGVWCGIEIKQRVRVLIFQSENDDFRIGQEFKRMKAQGLLPDDIGDWLRISKIPLCGLDLERVEFRAISLAEIKEFQPGFMMLDPWNSAAKKDMIDDYQRAFEALLTLAEPLDELPGYLIVHHLKKLKVDDYKLRGRSLMTLLAGSYVINSRPRSVFVAMEESPFVPEPLVIVTCAKNNNGKDSQRAAMRREEGTLVDVTASFDWKAYDSGALAGKPANENRKIEESDLIEVFDGGRKWLSKEKAAKALMQVAGAGRSAAYNALDMVKGRFVHLLRVNPANGQFSVHEEPEGWADDDEAED